MERRHRVGSQSSPSTALGRSLECAPNKADHRYVEITGVEVRLSDYTAIVISSDMKRTGHFECSHKLINQLHKNVVWGMLGNFVSVPTDCPQRDERLGWTGDLQVFAPTANYLFDTSGFLSGWLSDVAAETKHYNGIVPDVIPHISHELEGEWCRFGRR